MAKKRRRARRAPDPLAGPRHPPFGATKAQAKRYQIERDLKNRIHELETQLREETARAEHLANRLSAVSRPPRAALATICLTSVSRLVEAGIVVSDVVAIHQWLRHLDEAAP